MKLIKFIYPGAFPENVRSYYFSLEELRTFSYDSATLMWQFEFISGKQTFMIGHSKIDLADFEGFIFTNDPLIIFENRPFSQDENGYNIEAIESHLQEVKRKNKGVWIKMKFICFIEDTGYRISYHYEPMQNLVRIIHTDRRHKSWTFIFKDREETVYSEINIEEFHLFLSSNEQSVFFVDWQPVDPDSEAEFRANYEKEKIKEVS